MWVPAGQYLNRVVDEVRQYVLERAAIREHARQIFWYLVRQERAAFLGALTEQAQHLIVDGVEIERLHVELQPTRLRCAIDRASPRPDHAAVRRCAR